MVVDLTKQEIDTLLESLEYGKRNIREAQGTPYEVRQQNLARLDAVAAKLRTVRQG